MERQKMIKTIAETICLGYGRNFNDEKFEHQLMDLQVAGLVLTIIEQNGMAPPKIQDPEGSMSLRIWEEEL